MDREEKTLLVIGVSLAVVAYFYRGEVENAVVSLTEEFTRFDALYRKYGSQFGVPWRWLKAAALTESNNGRAKSVARGLAVPSDVEGSKSSDGKSWGLMQTTLTTARQYEGQMIEAPFLNNPENSVRIGAKYYRDMVKRFGLKDRESIVRAYNGGPGFRSTFQGQTVTPLYYSKWLANLQIILAKQPGNELEF